MGLRFSKFSTGSNKAEYIVSKQHNYKKFEVKCYLSDRNYNTLFTSEVRNELVFKCFIEILLYCLVMMFKMKWCLSDLNDSLYEIKKC